MPRVIRIEYEPNKAERYPCSKRGIKKLFQEFDTLDVFFEHKSIFRFEHGGQKSRDELVAEIFFMSAENERRSQQEFGGDSGGPTLWIYTVRKERYDENAAIAFREKVCPALNSWLEKQFSKPDTARLKDSKVSIEWDGAQHKLDYVEI